VHGLLVFYASRDMARDPEDSAAAAISCAASSAAVLCWSVDGRRQPVARVVDHVLALREVDVDPWIYAFPTPSRITESARHLIECARASGVHKVCADIEPFGGEDWTTESVELFVGLLLAAGLTVTVSVFTRKRWRRIDWERAAPGCPIWLQVYERVSDPEELADAIALWPGRTVVICVGTYAGDIARLVGDLANAVPHAKLSGAIAVWALGTTSPKEATALARWTLATWRPAA
jgi:hypothetical protein